KIFVFIFVVRLFGDWTIGLRKLQSQKFRKMRRFFGKFTKNIGGYLLLVKEKLRTKDFINITIITFFIFLSFYIPLTALPIYLADELSGGADQAGLLLTVFLIAAIIVRPFAGKWVKRGAEKKAFIYAAAACFAASLMYPF